MYEKHPSKNHTNQEAGGTQSHSFYAARNVRCTHMLFMWWVDLDTIEAFELNSVGVGPVTLTDLFPMTERRRNNIVSNVRVNPASK